MKNNFPESVGSRNAFSNPSTALPLGCVQLRKNTKAFKTIVSIIDACRDRPDRNELIRLFITKAGQTVKDRLYVDGLATDANLFYELNFQAIVNNLASPGYQLHVSDEFPGIYFLRGSNKTWDETPFEFAEIILKKFAGLPELPVVRKKEAHEKYDLPTAREVASPGVKTKRGEQQRAKSNASPPANQPAYRLQHRIDFTNLDKLIYTQGKINKRAVLDYYDSVADYLLPWLKDRALVVRPQSDTPTDVLELTKERLSADPSVSLPAWIQERTAPGGTKVVLCNDKDHLLYAVERGYLEFSAAQARLKSALPDYLVITTDSTDFSKTVEATLATGEVLTGLQLPSFLKSDGRAGFHVYVPLDAKSACDTGARVAEYICKLVRLKIPDLVTLNAADELTYGKVSLNHRLNGVGESVIAPYSLVSGSLPTVAAPLTWDELEQGLHPEDSNLATVPKKLGREGDPFEVFFKKKTNADALLARIEENYSFLVR